MSTWVNNLPSPEPTAHSPYFGTTQAHYAMNLLRGDNGKPSAVVAATIVTVISTFFVLIMLRPPIIMKQTHPHEIPKINIGMVIVWSLVAGIATLFLSSAGS